MPLGAQRKPTHPWIAFPDEVAFGRIFNSSSWRSHEGKAFCREGREEAQRKETVG